MLYILLKTLLTALIVVTVSELAKRYTTFAALLAALPFTSILAMIWLYVDTRNSKHVADLSIGIFWLVLPTLCFFLVLPWFLRHQFNFWLSMLVSCIIMIALYLAYAAFGRKLGLPI
ncbi:MAG TPA: DUF3147 family protein [Thermodesulfobacteriota bacterium]|nr:DUF3147 family protein [Thermodesulfobacteriota bacterium]